MEGHKKSIFIRCLLYLVLVTSVITSVTLSRYVNNSAALASGLVASFTTSTTMDLEIPLSDMLVPGTEKRMQFAVRNFDGEVDCEVPLDYSIQVETTGNLPLEFKLKGEKESADTDVENSVLVGTLGENLLASGGKLPSAGIGGKKTHTYELTILWPEEKSDENYSDEIDCVTLKITTAQRPA